MSRYWQKRKYSRGELQAVFADLELGEKRAIKNRGRKLKLAYKAVKRAQRRLLPSVVYLKSEVV